MISKRIKEETQKTQTSLDGDHRDRHGSKHPKAMPGLDWTHRNK